MTEGMADNCSGCGSGLQPPAETERNGYAVYRCRECASLMTRPLPSPAVIQALYHGYNEVYTAGMSADRYQTEMPKRWRARLRTLRRLGARGRLLDLGGANGMFGRIAAESGFQVSIADFMDSPVDLGFTTAVPADLNRPRGVPLPDAAFDVVTLWSCMEHLLDPDTALTELHRLCRPDGLVAIDTPLVGDLCERFWAARTHWVSPPEHLNLFSADGLAAALTRAGFDVIWRAPFYERSASRWVARRGRNLALAGGGAILRIAAPRKWRRSRQDRETSAGDIQVIVARRVNMKRPTR
jgi:SAM-dependent methyltransferase